MRKPAWLNKKVNLNHARHMKQLLRGLDLHTVCEESLCPNISECFCQHRTATFLILGNICTRQCSFCAITKGQPQPVDFQQAKRIVTAIQRLGLRYVVITSPTRDDLADGGAALFVETVQQIKAYDATIAVEILVPDFRGNEQAWYAIAQCSADVIAHNVETVPRLYPFVRRQADYQQSLALLRYIKRQNKHFITKSGIMVGLGETVEELECVFSDLATVGCSRLTIGQYLSPSNNHYLVRQYVSPEQFFWLRQRALRYGFGKVNSGPYVRSSYQAYPRPVPAGNGSRQQDEG